MADDVDVDRLHDQALDAAGRALHLAAGKVLADAIELTPLDEGTLRASGHVEPEVGATRVGDTVHVEVSFNTPYAAAQHEAHGPPSWENAERPLNYSEPDTGPKYLEKPLLDMAPRIEAAVARSVERAIENG